MLSHLATDMTCFFHALLPEIVSHILLDQFRDILVTVSKPSKVVCRSNVAGFICSLSVKRRKTTLTLEPAYLPFRSLPQQENHAHIQSAEVVAKSLNSNIVTFESNSYL